MKQRMPSRFRQQQILEMVERDGAVTVQRLAADFGIALMTIRRDLASLAERGLVIRVHGGAVAPPRGRSAMRSMRASFAMVVPDINYHWPTVTAAAQLEANARQVTLVARLSHSYGRDTLDQVKRLVRAGRVDGLIVAPFPTGDDRAELESWLLQNPHRAVYVDRTPSDPRLTAVHCVGVDNLAGGALAAEHLAGLGHTRMVMVTDFSAPGAGDRVQGWANAVCAIGVPALEVMDGVVMTDPHSRAHYAEILNRILELEATAVFANGDSLALALMQACYDRGVEVPEHLSLMGFDDELATLGTPPLTSVRTPKEAIGRTAIQLLAQLDSRYEMPVQRIAMVPSLIERESTAPPRG